MSSIKEAMGMSFTSGWKWILPYHSSFLSSSPSLRGKETLFVSARMSALFLIPEKIEARCKDSNKQYLYIYRALPCNETCHAATEGMRMNFGEKGTFAGCNNAVHDIGMPALDYNCIELVSLPSDVETHFHLMENLREIEDIFADSDMTRLKNDILLKIGQLGALQLFHACLSKTIKAEDTLKTAFSSTKLSKDIHIDKLVNNQMDSITIFSGKKGKRKSMRKRAARKLSRISDLPSLLISVNVEKLTSNSRRRLSIARNEVEMAKGVKEVVNLEKIHSNLKERTGHGPSIYSWATEAGIDVKVLQQRLNFGWRCRDKLLRSTYSLVLYFARNYYRRGMNLEDLLQAGNMGVLDGAERFDHTRGYQFSTYVQYWIRKSMSSLIAKHSDGIKIPVSLKNLMIRLNKAKRAFRSCNGRFPQDEEIAELTSLSLAHVRLAKKCSRVVGSIDQKIGHFPGVKFKDITADATIKTPEEIAMKLSMKQEIHDLLDALHPRERRVLMLRFGIEDGRHKSLAEVGKLFHSSKEWIRKIEKAALNKVRKEEVQSRLKHYLEI